MKKLILLILIILTITACDIIVPGPTPIPSPSPGASATPSPTAQPTATPTPTPSPSPTPWVCPLADQPECGGAETFPGNGIWGCCTEHASGTFKSVIQAAIKETQKTQPHLFNGDKVLYEEAYMKSVANVLQSYGYCAVHGAVFDEVGIKTTNGWSEQWDILSGDGYVRTNGFAVRCTPARF